MPVTNVKSYWKSGKLVFDQVRSTNGAIEIGDIRAYTSASYGINLGTRVLIDGVSTRRTRALAVCANDGGIDPADRIESSCHMFTQLVDWSGGWSATALEGAFYGGYDLIAVDDNMNISGAGGWIYLDDEVGGAVAPVVGTDAALETSVCGLESWVALPADVVIKAKGRVCGLKLSNNFKGAGTGAGHTYAIYVETVDQRGYDFVYGSNTMGNGFVASTANMGTAATFAAMIVEIAGQDGFIPVFFDKDWTAS